MQHFQMQEFDGRDDEFAVGVEHFWQHADGGDECLAALLDAADGGEDWYILHFACLRLLDALRFQFAVEESLMRIVSYPRLKQHALGHERIIERVEQLRDASLREGCVLNVAATRSLIEAHRADHDDLFARFFSTGLG